MFITDYHVHSGASFDCESPASISDILKTAAAGNIKQVAVCDHYDVNLVIDGSNPNIDFEDSRRQIKKAKREIKCGTEIMLGVELGQPHQSPESDAHARELINANNFDFVLCSLHSARNDNDFYYIDYKSADKAMLEQMFERYARELCELAEWHGFHALAHADYPVRYLKINKIDIDASKYYDIYKELFKILIRRGIALEINTSGLIVDNFRDTMPSFNLLKIYKAVGGELLITGSDSHSVRQLANASERCRFVYAKLLELGYKYISVMNDGKFNQLKIAV
jgi:histidinol-phosphatase (PHP family)